MSYIIVEGFEFQLGPSTAVLGAATAIYSLVNGTPTYDTSLKKHGAASLFVNAANERVAKATPPTTTGWAASFYVYFATLPADNMRVTEFAASVNTMFLIYHTSNQQLHMKWGTGAETAFGPVLATGQWYLIDIEAHKVDAHNWQTKARVDGANEATSGNGNYDGTMFDWRIGPTNGGNGPWNFDDCVMTNDYTDYPIGEHEVKLLQPNGDGTHSNATGSIEDSAGVDIDGSTVTAYTLLNDFDTADYVRQSATQAGEYAEVAFPDPTEASILAVEAYVRGSASGSVANNGTTRVVDGSGNTLVDVNSGQMHFPTGAYARVIVPDPGANGWSQADLDGLKVRVGFSTDADSIPWWQAFAFQYAVPLGGTLDPPANLAAVAVSPTQINLSWDDAAGATSYDIEEDATEIENAYTGSHSVGSPYQRTGRSPATEYDYRVRSRN